MVTNDRWSRIELPNDAYILDLKEAIKAALPVQFHGIDGPTIVVRNRFGDEIRGNIPISAYFASSSYNDDNLLGLSTSR